MPRHFHKNYRMYTRYKECQPVGAQAAKLYFCIARIGRADGCSIENKTLTVKGKWLFVKNCLLSLKIPLFRIIFLTITECTQDKDGQFSVNAFFTDRMTIMSHWKYRVESCDLAFHIYWSNKGPVDFNSKSKMLPLNTTSYEIAGLGKII